MPTRPYTSAKMETRVLAFFTGMIATNAADTVGTGFKPTPATRLSLSGGPLAGCSG